MMKFILSLLFIGAIFGQCEDDTATSRGVLINGFCACQAAFAPLSLQTECEDSIESSCSPLSTVAPLTSSSIGQLADASLSSNTISITVENTELFEGRLVSSVSLNDPSVDDCTYPGSAWIKTLDSANCKESYIGNIDWNLATDDNVGCGLKLSDATTEDEDVYDAEIIVTVEDQLESILGQAVSRNTQGSLLLQIRLPTKFTVTANVTVISQAEFSAAISSQSYDPVGETGEIVVTTAASAPYKIGNVNVFEYPESELLSSPLTVLNDITCETTGDCTQSITITSNPDLTGESCSFSGTYTLGVDLACREFPCTEVSENITLSIVSSELCGKIEISGSASGELDIYDSSTRDTSKGAFQEQEIIYFSLSVIADVDIDSLSATNLDVILETSPQQTTSLLTDGSLSSEGTNVGFSSTYNPSTNTLDFEFALIFGSSGLGFDMPEEGVALLSVVLDSEIVYSNGISQKRASLSTSSDLKFSRTVPVFRSENSDIQNAQTFQSSVMTSNASLVTIVGCIGFVLLVATKLRKRF